MKICNVYDLSSLILHCKRIFDMKIVIPGPFHSMVGIRIFFFVVFTKRKI